MKNYPFRWKQSLMILAGIALVRFSLPTKTQSVEIPLDSMTPIRIGFVDLQRVFDTYPEKSFAEGDLLREIEKRKRELGRHQTDINVLQQQISVDEAALAGAQKGAAVTVPVNTVPEPVAAPTAPPPAASTTTVKTSTAAVEDYPTDDPLAGLPGHEAAATANGGAPSLPGMKDTAPKQTMLDLLASATAPMVLNAEALAALTKRVADNKQRLDNSIAEFKTFRGNAVADMKVLQTQKTYGVMSKIYAVLQNLARDENVMVVMDKAYVLYGEDAVDLSDKLIERLQSEPQG
jgi:Skp family chaperone for outer membrane proteins